MGSLFIVSRITYAKCTKFDAANYTRINDDLTTSTTEFSTNTKYLIRELIKYLTKVRA